MRVTGGALGGRRLRVPRRGVRPTSDRVRESTFSILGDVTDFGVLDLFAGSGVLGVEALSRGARDAVFVERSPAALEIVRRNLEDLGLAERSRTLRMDASRAVRRLGAEGARLDLVFVDPPYEDDVEPLLRLLASSGILAPQGRVVLERRRGHAVEAVDPWVVVDQRGYGDTLVIHFGVRPGSEAASEE